MSDIFNIGVSALMSTQQVLNTIGHNIANANTPGYSRQRVELTARTPQLAGPLSQGAGVSVSSISRLADTFLTGQVQIGTANYSQSTAFQAMATQLNNLVADQNSGLSSALSDFFNGLQSVSTNPTSAASRQAFLGNADTLVSRFHDLGARINDLYNGINQQLGSQVASVNSIAKSIADLNKQIVLQNGQTGGNPSGDLLDKRDQLVTQLAGLVGVNTVQQADGALNVSIGNGVSLVVGSTAATLSTVPDPNDTSLKQVAYDVGGATSIISSNLTTGEIGGTLAFRTQMLDPARNALGRIGAVLAQTFNAQHVAGMDLNGAMGTNFFSLPAPGVNAAATNTGSITVAFDQANAGNLTTSDYSLKYDGTNYVLTRLSDNSTQTLAGAGPFNVEGLTITPTGAPATGDSYLIQPTRYVASGIDMLITDPRQIAAASPVRSSATSTNLGSAAISPPTVTNAANAGLLTTTTLVFDNPPTSYKINGAGASIAYTSGAAIGLNGWQVSVSGTPQAGDQFVVQANAGGTGDNSNAAALANLQNAKTVAGGTASYQDAYAAFIGDIGTQTSQNNTSVTALKTMLDNAVSAQQQISGVNLDEEAANMMQFQQAYQAAAQVISSANQMFNELITAIRG